MADIEIIKGADNGNPPDTLRQMYPKVNRNFQNMNNEIAANKTDADNKLEAHKNSTTAHPAQHIPYTGDIVGVSDVKGALDKTKQTIDDLILGSGDSGPEVAAARGGYPTLGDRLDSSDAQLADLTPDVYRVVDLFAMSGQSNMQGQSEASPTPFEIPQRKAYEYKLLTDSLETVKHPFGENIDDLLLAAHNGWGSLSPKFAEAYYNTTGTPPLMVGVAKGSTVVTDWIGNARYAKVVEKVNGAVSKADASGLIVRNKYFVWLQGESDGIANTSKQAYKQSFMSLWTALKQDCGFTRCLIIRVAKFYDYNMIPIIKAQEELSREQDDIVMLSRETGYFTESNGYMQSIWHYTNAGYDRIGTIAGKAAGKYINTTMRPTLEVEPYSEAVVADAGQYSWNFRDGSVSGGILLSSIGTPGVFDTAILDGVSGFKLSKDINLDGDATISITCLFNTPSTGGGIFTSYDGDVNRDFIFYYLEQKTINIATPYGNPTVKFTETDDFTPNLATYNHFVIQKFGSIYSLYVNGKQIQTIFGGAKALNINTLFFGDLNFGINGKVKHCLINKGTLVPPKECDPTFYANNEQGTT